MDHRWLPLAAYLLGIAVGIGIGTVYAVDVMARRPLVLTVVPGGLGYTREGQKDPDDEGEDKNGSHAPEPQG